MRLSSKEQLSITRAFSLIIPNPFQLYLFGSRTDDQKKGGDIDLLLVVAREHKSGVIELKTKVRSEIFKHIPEQKIDITVAIPEELQQEPFLKSIFPECIQLSNK